MRPEDLFQAIGQVEDSRLVRSEITVAQPSGTQQEGTAVYKRNLTPGRIIRNILVAAAIVCLLAATAFAAMGYILYDDPKDMLDALFGNSTGYDHNTGGEVYDENGNLVDVERTFDRVEADEKVIQEDILPNVSPVGRSISWKGCTLTVDAVMYDAASKCGMVTYILENPDGLKEYSVSYDGEIIFREGEPVEINQYGHGYIIQEKTTPSAVAVAYYFQIRDGSSENLELTLSQWCWRTMEMVREEQKMLETMTQEELDAWFEAFPVCPDTITIGVDELGELKNIALAGGGVVLSPISIDIDVTDLGYLLENPDSGTEDIETVTICYANGTEYPVTGPDLHNAVFAVTDMDRVKLTLMFNRIIDVDQVVSVVINGTAFQVSR